MRSDARQRAAALPKSPLGAAIGYALRNWVALTRYTEDGRLKIDNNGRSRRGRSYSAAKTGSSPGAKWRRTAPQSRVRWCRPASTCGSIRSSICARDEAYARLAAIYNWFTEGFDTADLKDAKALLEELRG